MSDDVEPPIVRRVLEDGRILELWKMIYNVRLTVTLPENDGMYWSDCWCFRNGLDAMVAFTTWSGEGEPEGWIKHPPSGRWRPDGTPASERGPE